MRAIVQRVGHVAVTVDGEVVGRIDRGLLVYVGVGADDGPDDVDYVAGKIRHLRIFPDDAAKMNLDVAKVGGQVLVVSNFTLQADIRQGRRPAFTQAADPAVAEELYVRLCDRLRELGLKVETGLFGAIMSVEAANDGPINILVDSKRGF
ncbi:MAG: D-tyrosyl-tRNA(Tyr) deacylase [Phycisphaerae bacterium]|nr:D-tyrosyl-tRNA(Tyr) deacylase [Phycisphaerae bacterium]